jgi:hypothetical protein
MMSRATILMGLAAALMGASVVVDSQLDNEFFLGCILRTVEDLKFNPPDGVIRVNIPDIFRQEE